LIQAFAHSELSKDWCLVFAGVRDGQEQIQEQARCMGLEENRFKIIPWVEEEELPVLIGGAAFYCCPSLHEGYGLPVIESQACGTPVLASNRGALPETLGRCGILFDPELEEDFIAGLERMAEDPVLRKGFAEQGLKRVQAESTWDHVAAKTLAIFKELC